MNARAFALTCITVVTVNELVIFLAGKLTLLLAVLLFILDTALAVALYSIMEEHCD